MKYFFLSENEQRNFNRLNLDKFFVQAINVLFPDIPTDKKLSNLFEVLQKNSQLKDKIDSYIEQMLKFCTYIDNDRFGENCSALQIQQFFCRYSEQTVFIKYLFTSINKYLYELSSPQKNGQQRIFPNIQGPIYTLPKALKSKARQKFKERFSITPECLFAAGVLFIIELIWQNMTYIQQIEAKMLEKCFDENDWKITELIPIISSLYLSCQQLLYQAEANKNYVRARMTSAERKYQETKDYYQQWKQDVNITAEDFKKRITPSLSLKTIQNRYLYQFKKWNSNKDFPTLDMFCKEKYFSQ